MPSAGAITVVNTLECASTTTPVVHSRHVRDGFCVVETTAERDALPLLRTASFVFVTATETLYRCTDAAAPTFVSVEIVPSQTGNIGKVLSTDGTSMSWVTP